LNHKEKQEISIGGRPLMRRTSEICNRMLLRNFSEGGNATFSTGITACSRSFQTWGAGMWYSNYV